MLCKILNISSSNMYHIIDETDNYSSKILTFNANCVSKSYCTNNIEVRNLHFEELDDESDDDATSINIKLQSQEDLSSVGLLNIPYENLLQGCRPSAQSKSYLDYECLNSFSQLTINNAAYNPSLNVNYRRYPQQIYTPIITNVSDFSNTVNHSNSTCICNLSSISQFVMEPSLKRKCVCNFQNKRGKCGSRIDFLKDSLIPIEVAFQHDANENVKEDLLISPNGCEPQNGILSDGISEAGNYLNENTNWSRNFLTEEHFQQPLEPAFSSPSLPDNSYTFNEGFDECNSYNKSYNETSLQNMWNSHISSPTIGYQEQNYINSSESNLPSSSSLNTSQDSKCSGEKDEYLKWLYETEFKVGFIDTHCHIDFLFKKEDITYSFEKFISISGSRDPFPKCFEGCVTVFCDPHSFFKLNFWEDILSSENVWGAFGCHPHYSNKFGPDEESVLRFALNHRKVKAVGEIGLDYSGRNANDHDLQKAVFKQQISIALDVRKPIVVHCRDAFEDAFEIMKKMLPKNYTIHLHCFTGSLLEASQWMDQFPNLYLGFTGIVAQTNQRAVNVRRVAKLIPLNRILLETDAPYHRPSSLKDGSCSHPGMAVHVAATIAELHHLSIEKVLEVTRMNTHDVYNI